VFSSLHQDGFCVVPRIISEATREALLAQITAQSGAKVHGARDLLDFAFIHSRGSLKQLRWNAL